MAKIKIQDFESSSVYKNSLGDIAFSLVSAPKKGRNQVMRFVSCKAFLHDATYTHVLGKGGNGYYTKGKNPPIDMEKLRLLVATGTGDIEAFKEKLFAAKKVVNRIEKTAGWKPSKIVTIDHSRIKRDVWLITGPKEWIRSPQMLSMITLILRVCVRRGPVKARTKEDIEKMFKKWGKGDRFSCGDTHYMKTSWDKLFLIAKHHDELFKDLSLTKIHNAGKIGSHGNGISEWCCGNAGCNELNKRLKKLCKKNKIKLHKPW